MKPTLCILQAHAVSSCRAPLSMQWVGDLNSRFLFSTYPRLLPYALGPCLTFQCVWIIFCMRCRFSLADGTNSSYLADENVVHICNLVAVIVFPEALLLGIIFQFDQWMNFLSLDFPFLSTSHIYSWVLTKFSEILSFGSHPLHFSKHVHAQVAERLGACKDWDYHSLRF